MSAVTNHSTPATGRDPTMGHIARECGATGAPLAAGHHTITRECDTQ